jgi:hypothetical protein
VWLWKIQSIHTSTIFLSSRFRLPHRLFCR